jgi:hypothetical protein
MLNGKLIELTVRCRILRLVKPRADLLFDCAVAEGLRELEEEVQEAASKLEFEKAALLRDQIMEWKKGQRAIKQCLRWVPGSCAQSARVRSQHGRHQAAGDDREELKHAANCKE